MGCLPVLSIPLSFTRVVVDRLLYPQPVLEGLCKSCQGSQRYRDGFYSQPLAADTRERGYYVDGIGVQKETSDIASVAIMGATGGSVGSCQGL